MGNQNTLRINLRRDIVFHKCIIDPIDELVGEAKVEAIEYLENLLIQKKFELLQVDLDHPFRNIVKIVRSTVTSHSRCLIFMKSRVGRNPNHGFGERMRVDSR
jgi:hypothetical protein